MRIKYPLITISYTDEHGQCIKRFDDCWSLAQFFKDCDPDLREAFKYTPKAKPKEPKSVVDEIWECLQVFGDRDYVNNLDGHDRGRIMSQDARYIDKHANGYYLTKEGKDFIAKMKPFTLKK